MTSTPPWPIIAPPTGFCPRSAVRKCCFMPGVLCYKAVLANYLWHLLKYRSRARPANEIRSWVGGGRVCAPQPTRLEESMAVSSYWVIPAQSPAWGKSVDIPFASNLWFQLVSFPACLSLIGSLCISLPNWVFSFFLRFQYDHCSYHESRLGNQGRKICVVYFIAYQPSNWAARSLCRPVTCVSKGEWLT